MATTPELILIIQTQWTNLELCWEKQSPLHYSLIQIKKLFLERFYEFDEGGLKREKDLSSLSVSFFLG